MRLKVVEWIHVTPVTDSYEQVNETCQLAERSPVSEEGLSSVQLLVVKRREVKETRGNYVECKSDK